MMMAVEGAVTGGGDAGVGLVDDAEARVAAGVGIEDKIGAVFAAIVGAKTFPVREGLREDGIKAFPQIRRHVVDRYNHREERRPICSPRTQLISLLHHDGG